MQLDKLRLLRSLIKETHLNLGMFAEHASAAEARGLHIYSLDAAVLQAVYSSLECGALDECSFRSSTPVSDSYCTVRNISCVQS